MKLMGYRECHYKFQDGRSWDGFKLFVEVPASESPVGTVGDSCDIINIPMSMASQLPPVGSEFTVAYNRYGKVAAIDCR